MKEQQAKTINQIFSIPLESSEELHTYVKQYESHFVSNAIRKEFEAKKEELREAYRMSNSDEGQIEATEEWKPTLSDGMDER